MFWGQMRLITPGVYQTKNILLPVGMKNATTVYGMNAFIRNMAMTGG